MNPLSWIRWKYFVPAAVLLAAVLVFFVIFFDPLLARGIEKAGNKVNGAKVEVAGLKTKFFKGRLNIARLQVADPEQPMQNRFEAGPLAFQLDLSELAARRVIVDEASMKGLGFNTPRKTSGALPKIAKKKKAEGPPSAAEKLAAKYKDRFKLNIDGIKSDAKAKVDFDPKELELTKTAEGLKEKAQTLPDQWRKRVDDLHVEERLKKAEEELKTIKQTSVKGVEALTAVPAALKKVGEVKSLLDAVKKDVQEMKGDIQSEAKELKGDAAGLSHAKKRDLDGLMSRLNLDFADPDRLVEGIIGPLVVRRFQTVFHYVQLARQHMPSQKEKDSLPPKPRVAGMDIEFPTPAAPPRFWLMKGALEGTYGAIGASGSLSDLTTDPARVGKPFKLDLNGRQGAQTFLAKATLDHTKDVNNDSLIFQANGLDVTSLVPPAEGAGLTFTKGAADLTMALNLIGADNIGGQIRMGISGLKIDASALAGGDKLKTDFLNNVTHAVESMKEVTVEAQVVGTWSDPSLKITSNLAPVLSNVIKESIGNMLKDQRKQLEARLDALLGEKQKEVNEKLAGIESKVSQQLSGFDKEIQQKISEASGINLSSEDGSPIPGIKIPSLKKLPW